MSDCPKLDFKSGSLLHSSYDEYQCKLTGRKPSEIEVKYTCKGYGDAYKDCPVYKNS